MEALPLPCCKTPLVHGIGPLPRYPLAPSMTVIRLRSESYRFELPPHSLSHMHSSSRPLGCSGIGCTFFSPRDCQTFSPRDCQTLFSSRFGERPALLSESQAWCWPQRRLGGSVDSDTTSCFSIPGEGFNGVDGVRNRRGERGRDDGWGRAALLLGFELNWQERDMP